MFSHMIDVMPTLDQTHKSTHDGARTSDHPIWRQELLLMDLSRLMALIV